MIADTLVEAVHSKEEERTHSFNNLLCRHVREQRVARHPARIVHPAGEAIPHESFFMWLYLANHLAHVAEAVQHLCPHGGSAVSGRANSREAFLSADATAHLLCMFSSKVPVSVAGAQAAGCRGFQAAGQSHASACSCKELHVLTAGHSRANASMMLQGATCPPDVDRAQLAPHKALQGFHVVRHSHVAPQAAHLPTNCCILHTSFSAGLWCLMGFPIMDSNVATLQPLRLANRSHNVHTLFSTPVHHGHGEHCLDMT